MTPKELIEYLGHVNKFLVIAEPYDGPAWLAVPEGQKLQFEKNYLDVLESCRQTILAVNSEITRTLEQEAKNRGIELEPGKQNN